MSNNNDNLENKPQISHVLAHATGNKIKRVLSGNKLKPVVTLASNNKIKRVLDGLKLSSISKAKSTKKVIPMGLHGPKSLPKIVGDIRHYPPANKE